MQAEPRLIAHFRPQLWINDYAVDIDDGQADFDATEKFLSLSLEEVRFFQENNYDSDYLADDLPERQFHDGPFEVDVEIDDWLKANGIEDGREYLTQVQLNELRSKYGVIGDGSEKPPAPKKLASALWTEKNAKRSFEQGWGLAQFDYPELDRPVWCIVAEDDAGRFSDDLDAVKAVLHHARQGDFVAIKALYLHNCPVNFQPLGSELFR